MNPRPDAEKLLGGFATGTLTEAEKALLYAAALDDQQLFEALADEETLREVLADPAVREHLLKVLAPKVIPWWRKPTVLGLAATVFLILTTQLVVKRTPMPEPSTPALKALPTPQELGEPPAQVRPNESTRALREPVTPVENKKGRAPQAPEKPQAAEAGLAGAPPTLAEPKAPAAAGPPAPVLADTMEAPKRDAAPRAEKAEQAAAKESRPAPQGGGQNQVGQVAGTVSRKKATPERSSPTWTLERLPDQRLRLQVVRSSGFLYLIARQPRDSHMLEPRQESTKQGQYQSTFEWTPREGEVVDLYHLLQPTPAPLALPATGPLDGWRVRVWPALMP